MKFQISLAQFGILLTTVLATMEGCSGSDAGTPSPDLGTALFDDKNLLVLDYAVSLDGSHVYASTLLPNLNGVGATTQIRSVDLVTRESAVLMDKTTSVAKSMRVASDGSLFFQTDFPQYDALTHIALDGTSKVVTNCNSSGDVTGRYALSHDAKRVACLDPTGGSFPILPIVVDVATGTKTYLSSTAPAGVPWLFSPDGKELLLTTDISDQGSAPAFKRASTDPKATTPAVDVHYEGDELLLIRWEGDGLTAITRKADAVYLEDLVAGTKTTLWTEKSPDAILGFAYAWADQDHVFQLAPDSCTKLAGMGCDRVRFHVVLRSLRDGSQKTVTYAEGSKQGYISEALGGSRFVWLLDDELYVHDL